MEEIINRIEEGKALNKDIETVIAGLDSGEIRIAENVEGEWKVNTWAKQAVMAYFGICKMEDTKVGEFIFRDKIPLKQSFANVRLVPGGNSVRYGSYLSDNVIMMPPSYVNIGAYVGSGSMIDSNALVGSCAQIGNNVHLSAGVQIGGVLEPVGARPVIIEDGVFIGAGAIVVEGLLIGKNAVLAPGVVLSASTRILETDKEGKIINEYRGEVPPEAIVVAGARQRGEVMLQTPIIIGYRNENTDDKIGLSDFLRSF